MSAVRQRKLSPVAGALLLISGCLMALGAVKAGQKAGPAPAGERESKVVASQDALLKEARQAAAAMWQIPAEQVEIDALEDLKIPGILVFTAKNTLEQGRRGAWTAGVAYEGGVELDRDKAMARVLKAWKSGSKKPAPVAAVARALGTLETRVEPTRPVWKKDDIEMVRPNWREYVFLPREATVEGKPAIEYWNRSGEPPLWRSQVVVQPDGSTQLSTRLIWDFDTE